MYTDARVGIAEVEKQDTKQREKDQEEIMTIGQVAWTRLYTLAQQARVAGTTRQRLEIRLSPEESTALADVLEAALHMMTAVMGKSALDMDEPSADELAHLAMQGGAFDWLVDEPDLYSDDDLKERFEWVPA